MTRLIKVTAVPFVLAVSAIACLYPYRAGAVSPCDFPNPPKELNCPGTAPKPADKLAPRPPGQPRPVVEEVCLGAIPACEKYKSLKAAVDAIESMGRKQSVLKVYPAAGQSIPSGGAVIKFSLDLVLGDGAVDTPVIAGECVEVFGVNSVVKFGIDGIELRSCLKVQAAASVTLRNTTFGPPLGVPKYSAAITLTNVKHAVLDNVQIEGHSVGIAIEGASTGIFGGSEIRNADIGLLVRKTSRSGYTSNIKSLKIERSDRRGTGIVVESGVRDSIVVEGAVISGLAYAVDAQSPLRVQNSFLINNGTAIRLGEASRFYSHRINGLPYVFQGITLENNSLELRIAASLPNLTFSTSSWPIAELRKRVAVDLGAKIENCDETLKAMFAKFEGACSGQHTFR